MFRNKGYKAQDYKTDDVKGVRKGEGFGVNPP